MKSELNEKKFTLEEIKIAFWKEFHKSGELWFNYLGEEKENQDSTEVYWDSFLKKLLKKGFGAMDLTAIQIERISRNLELIKNSICGLYND